MALNRYNSKRKPGTGLSILLAVAMIILFFVASIAVSFVFVVLLSDDQKQHSVGINYGRVADDLPSPTRVVQLLQSLKIRSVKIYDANTDVLKAFQGTNIRLSIMVTNQQIEQMADGSNFSDSWVQQNIAAYPSVKIERAIVGNEILSDGNLKPIWTKLVPAMENLHSSLQKMGYGKKITVTTALALDCLKVSYPPSDATFKDDMAESVIRPLLTFLDHTGSSFYINVYPYFAWLKDQQKIPLDYALFKSSSPIRDDQSGLFYENLLDAQLDALVVAMTRMGYGQVGISISETGWPTKGNEGASIQNAADYNRRLVLRILGKGGHKNKGTPKRPGRIINTYIFALFNEDDKPGDATERNWGILYPNGSKVYEIDFTGRTPINEYQPLPVLSSSTLPSNSSSSSSLYRSPSVQTELPRAANLTNHNSSSPSSNPRSNPSAQSPSSNSTSQHPSASPSSNSTSQNGSSTPSSNSTSPSSSPSSNSTRQSPSSSRRWCVAVTSDLSPEEVQGAMDYACGAGRADCTAIQPGQPCYLPNVMQNHASYAFNSYWQKMKKSGGTCNFNGAAKLTNIDPSYGSCMFPVS